MDAGLDDWIYWHFFTITINYDSSQSTTVYNSLCSLLDSECPPFCMTDLVLISTSATSSASVVHWLILHSWTLNYWSAFWILLRINLLKSKSESESESESYVMTDSLSWKNAPIWGLWPDLYYCQTVVCLLMWGAVSDKRMDLSFTTVAGPRQCSHPQIRVPWDSWPYFTASDSRHPISSPPTTCRVML
jgi:hypothetical protein